MRDRHRKIECRTNLSRRGFTLVEMLVVITILIILAALTFTLVNFSLDAERLSSGSRQIQNYLEGARDRAIHANEPRGVRFILDATNPVDSTLLTVSSVVYIGPPEEYSEGKVTIDPADNRTINPTGGADWGNLAANNFLINGARIRINKKNTLYTVVSNGGGGWQLTRDFADLINTPLDYKLELAPAILADQEPSQLPRDIVIDLNNSRIPSGWTSTSRMDIMFSPRGTVIGKAATSGLVHLLLSDLKDLEAGFGIGNLNKTQGETLVTIVTKTGAVNTSGVDPTDSDNDGNADDPFRFAETGKESK